MNEHEVYNEAVHRFGRRHQMVKAIEELSELIKELCKNLDGAANKANICEEIADVEIMIEQVKIILGDEWETYLALKKAEKIGRLAGMLAGDYEDEPADE